MERSRLKTIIILILLLVNVFLLVSILQRSRAEQETRQQAAQQLVDLFLADNIHLDIDTIPSRTPPNGQAFTRDTTQDRALVSVFLGEGLTSSDQGGGIVTYGSNAGAARCSSNGSFDIIGTQISSDAEGFSRKFCRDHHYKELSVQLDESLSGTITAVRYHEKYPVFNCTVTFTVTQDAIRKVSGTHLPEDAVPYVGQEPLSAAAALDVFLSARRESGALVSLISEIYLCYEVKGTTLSPMTLFPCWCIVTDTSNYYVNCYTGEVSHI